MSSISFSSKKMQSEMKPMTSKLFFDENEIEDIDPASEYEEIVGDT